MSVICDPVRVKTILCIPALVRFPEETSLEEFDDVLVIDVFESLGGGYSEFFT